MESCVYSNINTVKSDYEQNGTGKWTFLLRQSFVCSALWLMYFIPGLFFGAPPVFIAQTRREANSTDAVSAEMASWLSSLFGYAALPWIFILPLMSHRFGRKIPFYFLCLSAICSHILLYCSSTVIEFLISEIIASITVASHTTLTMLIIAEYTSPQYRGVFLTLKSATVFWGIWIGNALGTFSHWKNIGLIGIVSSIYCATAVFWPESPYWLASKGRYQECSEAHYWLKGFDEKSKKELEITIQNHKTYNKMSESDQATHISIRKLISIRKVSDNPEFYKPLLLSFVLSSLYHCSGKFVCSMYILDIVKRVTMSESTAYLTMLVLDGCTVFGMYLGCLLTKFLNRKTFLLTFASIGVFFLYLISLYLYLINCEILNENKIVVMSLLTGFSVFFSIGPIVLISSIYAEIIPLKYNHLASCILSLFDRIMFASILKLAPTLFKTFGLHGSFFFYGISSTISILILSKYLPETKDKTLHEIANYFKNKKLNEIDTLNDPNIVIPLRQSGTI